MQRILFIVNDPNFFLSHRLPLAVAARAVGYEVHVATASAPAVALIERQGFTFHHLPLSRSGTSPLQELLLLYAIYRLFRSVRPDLAHLVTIKPVLYGGIAARLACVPSLVAAVSGLGFVFTATNWRSSLLRRMVSALYRLAFGKKRLRVIFQNPDDRDALIRLGILDPSKALIIRGSGTDLTECRYLPEPDGVPVVVMAARLLRDKGVLEFISAAELLQRQGVQAHFVLAGEIDPDNPASLTSAEVAVIQKAGFVDVAGYCNNIPSLFAASHVVVLPSYREGLPKVLVEAAACGRAVITTDVPGCRDAIEVGCTGWLVPAYDSAALAVAMQRLIEQPALRQEMGAAGRSLAENEFGIERIAARHLDIYRELLEELA